MIIIKIIIKVGDRIVRILKVNIINFYIKIESTNIHKKLLLFIFTNW